MKKEIKKRYFKGFDSELKCLDMQFQIGGIHSAKNTTGTPAICTDKVIHFCTNIKDVHKYYSILNERDTNRLCEVRPIPGHEIVSDSCGDKFGCRHIEVLREIPKETVKRYARFTKYLQSRQVILDNHKLPMIQELQRRYPQLILCGSAAVFLHTGKVYDRNSNSAIHDLDFVSPYYIRLEGDDEHKLSETFNKLWEDDYGFDEGGVETAKHNTLKVSNRDKWGSGNDFDECVYINNVPVDIAVNPAQKYEYITFQGFRYKVATLSSILEAKLRYANQGNAKHSQDIMDLIKLPQVFKI